MINKTELIRVLTELSSCNGESFETFMIGGGALVFHDLQNYTKDIDLVSFDDQNHKGVLKTAERVGFTLFLETEEAINRPRTFEKPASLIRENVLIDVFNSRTTHYNLSLNMVRRAVNITYCDGKSISVLCPEDILLLKTATGRPSDSRVLRKIIENRTIDWAIVLDEILTQTEMGNIRAAHNLLFAYDEAQLYQLTNFPREIYAYLLTIINDQMKKMEDLCTQ